MSIHSFTHSLTLVPLSLSPYTHLPHYSPPTLLTSHTPTHTHSLTIQDENTEERAQAKARYQTAKICDDPTCGVKVDKVTLFACRRCRVGTYCCHEHHVAHWPAHMSLCKEIQRRCDHPKCEKRAEIKCAKCMTATYCSREHGEAHWKAHESRCKELRAV
jgi:hypothetical protein